jgi:hypothetical protein
MTFLGLYQANPSMTYKGILYDILIRLVSTIWFRQAQPPAQHAAFRLQLNAGIFSRNLLAKTIGLESLGESIARCTAKLGCTKVHSKHTRYNTVFRRQKSLTI